MRKSTGWKRPVAGIILALFCLLTIVGVPVAATAHRRQSSGTTIVVDAGHGGDDGGVKGTKSGVLECELNLKMSKIVTEYFSASGFRAVQTRKNERSLNSVGARFKKKSDLDERIRIIQKSAPAAVVSLHMNYCPIPSRRGAQVFYDRSSNESAALAECIQTSLNLSFNKPDTGREYAALTAEKYLLQNVKCPIVIVECGFLSNPTDERNLLSADYRAALAHAIFDGVCEYLYVAESPPDVSVNS